MATTATGGRWRGAILTAARSAARTIPVIRRLQWSGPRLGAALTGPDGRRYIVFRDTSKPPDSGEKPVVIEASFVLPWLGRAGSLRHRLFRRVCIGTFPLFSGLEGYGIKLWAVEADGTRYLGVYEWAGVDSARAYLRALLPILEALSTRGSVTSNVVENMDLAPYLGHHDAVLRRAA